MQVHAVTDRLIKGNPTQDGYDTVRVQSNSNHDIFYTVDITLGRCSCPAWTLQRMVGGVRKPCKHLRDLGFVAVV